MSITFSRGLLFQSKTSQIDARREEHNVLSPNWLLHEFNAQKTILDGVLDIITSFSLVFGCCFFICFGDDSFCCLFKYMIPF